MIDEVKATNMGEQGAGQRGSQRAEATARSVPKHEHGMKIERYFTRPDSDPFDEVEWELRTAAISHGGEGATRAVIVTADNRRALRDDEVRALPVTVDEKPARQPLEPREVKAAPEMVAALPSQPPPQQRRPQPQIRPPRPSRLSMATTV